MEFSYPISRSVKILQNEGIFSFLDKFVGPNGWLHTQLRRLHFYISNLINFSLINLILKIPTLILLILFENWSLLSRTNRNVIVIPVRGGAKTFEVSTLKPVARIPSMSEAYHATHTHRSSQLDKYTPEKFVELKQGDTVVDVGAYVGSLTLELGPDVGEIIAIDPNAAIDSSLEENTRDLKNVSVVPKAAWNKSDTLNLNLSVTSNDNSIFAVDSNTTDQSVAVSAERVADIASDYGLDQIDFLKIEAEGAEPEVLEGALDGSIAIEAVAVDCAPERDGESPRDEIQTILKQSGYDVKCGWNGRVVYAKKDPW